MIKIALVPFYLARRQVNYRVLGILCAGGIPGVIAGFYLLESLSANRQHNTVLLLLGMTIVVVALVKVVKSVRGNVERAARDRSVWLLPISAVIGTEVGFSSAGAGALG